MLSCALDSQLSPTLIENWVFTIFLLFLIVYNDIWRTDLRRSRRHFSSLGNTCLHLKGISTLRQCKKGYKTHFPPWFMGSPVCIPQHAVFLFSSLWIKYFQPLLWVCLCFHSQSRLKNPEHLKFLHVSSMHHIWQCMKPSPEVGIGFAKLGMAA
jgi:hypothetical protein